MSVQVAEVDLQEANRKLERLDARARVEWAFENLPGAHALTTSFGIQAAVSLHLVTRVDAATPVLFADTGYLFPETYQFARELTERLQLNLRICRAELSPAEQEARFGKLWEQGQEGMDRYNRLNKVEPMARAFEELDIGSWFSGLRREQAESRRNTAFVDFTRGRYRIHPLADWTSKDVWKYLGDHKLPYHPLWEQGYVSVGDTHSTLKLESGMREEDTRFAGLKRECGLHTEL